ncbi:hypothetical protein [Wolbachia endosymbiont (group A) of Scambus nigricans]|uniref:hypothetical protein n=1 Tax=Wolbachia endosymbiont (group A) of Scambus nigricans TaxID=2954055 RepID=UPI0038781739
MLLACYSHKHISYRIRTIIRKAIVYQVLEQKSQQLLYSPRLYFLSLLLHHNLLNLL